MSGSLAHYRMFAHYNAWANALLYESAAKLSDKDYHADRGAFFRSMHGTLNHLLVTDRIWMSRFTGGGVAPARLDMILYDDLHSLRAAREAEDSRIIDYTEHLDEADISRSISYRRVSSSERFEQRLAPALSHLFNHQTHHRGQAHTLLTILTADGPKLDLVYFQREFPALSA